MSEDFAAEEAAWLQDESAAGRTVGDAWKVKLSEMSAAGSDDTRRVEVHFSLDDQALVLEMGDDPDGEAVDDLMDALEAVDINEAEHRLQRTTTGARPVGRLGSYRRW